MTATAAEAIATTPAASPGRPAVSASGVVRRYGDRVALDGLTLDVPEGSVFGLLGPNGSGKSTFLALVMAMAVPDAGELRVFGEAPAARWRAQVGAVFQENTADPLMRPGEYLRLAGRMFGLSASVLDERIPAVLAAFGLRGREGDAVATLSGGMRRRLEAARAVLHDPRLLLLDEPTTGVDPGERRALWEAMLAHRGEHTILLATNDLSEAEDVCDRVAFLDAGDVVATGSPAELKRGLRAQTVYIRWEALSAADLGAICALPGAGDVVPDRDGVRVNVDDASAFVPEVFRVTSGQIRSVEVTNATLEDAYFRYVGARTPRETLS